MQHSAGVTPEGLLSGRLAGRLSLSKRRGPDGCTQSNTQIHHPACNTLVLPATTPPSQTAAETQTLGNCSFVPGLDQLVVQSASTNSPQQYYNTRPYMAASPHSPQAHVKRGYGPLPAAETVPVCYTGTCIKHNPTSLHVTAATQRPAFTRRYDALATTAINQPHTVIAQNNLNGQVPFHLQTQPGSDMRQAAGMHVSLGFPSTVNMHRVESDIISGTESDETDGERQAALYASHPEKWLNGKVCDEGTVSTAAGNDLKPEDNDGDGDDSGPVFDLLGISRTALAPINLPTQGGLNSNVSCTYANHQQATGQQKHECKQQGQLNEARPQQQGKAALHEWQQLDHNHCKGWLPHQQCLEAPVSLATAPAHSELVPTSLGKPSEPLKSATVICTWNSSVPTVRADEQELAYAPQRAPQADQKAVVRYGGYSLLDDTDDELPSFDLLGAKPLQPVVKIATFSSEKLRADAVVGHDQDEWQQQLQNIRADRAIRSHVQGTGTYIQAGLQQALQPQRQRSPLASPSCTDSDEDGNIDQPEYDLLGQHAVSVEPPQQMHHWLPSSGTGKPGQLTKDKKQQHLPRTMQVAQALTIGSATIPFCNSHGTATNPELRQSSGLAPPSTALQPKHSALPSDEDESQVDADGPHFDLLGMQQTAVAGQNQQAVRQYSHLSLPDKQPGHHYDDHDHDCHQQQQQQQQQSFLDQQQCSPPYAAHASLQRWSDCPVSITDGRVPKFALAEQGVDDINQLQDQQHREHHLVTHKPPQSRRSKPHSQPVLQMYTFQDIQAAEQVGMEEEADPDADYDDSLYDMLPPSQRPRPPGWEERQRAKPTAKPAANCNALTAAKPLSSAQGEHASAAFLVPQPEPAAALTISAVFGSKADTHVPQTADTNPTKPGAKPVLRLPPFFDVSPKQQNDTRKLASHDIAGDLDAPRTDPVQPLKKIKRSSKLAGLPVRAAASAPASQLPSPTKLHSPGSTGSPEQLHPHRLATRSLASAAGAGPAGTCASPTDLQASYRRNTHEPTILQNNNCNVSPHHTTGNAKAHAQQSARQPLKSLFQRLLPNASSSKQVLTPDFAKGGQQSDAGYLPSKRHTDAGTGDCQLDTIKHTSVAAEQLADDDLPAISRVKRQRHTSVIADDSDPEDAIQTDTQDYIEDPYSQEGERDANMHAQGHTAFASATPAGGLPRGPTPTSAPYLSHHNAASHLRPPLPRSLPTTLARPPRPSTRQVHSATHDLPPGSAQLESLAPGQRHVPQNPLPSTCATPAVQSTSNRLPSCTLATSAKLQLSASNSAVGHTKLAFSTPAPSPKAAQASTQQAAPASHQSNLLNSLLGPASLAKQTHSITGGIECAHRHDSPTTTSGLPPANMYLADGGTSHHHPSTSAQQSPVGYQYTTKPMHASATAATQHIVGGTQQQAALATGNNARDDATHGQAVHGQASDAEPWWKLLPDFVPVQVLEETMMDRFGQPVHIIYSKQFTSESAAAPHMRGRSAGGSVLYHDPAHHSAPGKRRRSNVAGRHADGHGETAGGDAPKGRWTTLADGKKVYIDTDGQQYAGKQAWQRYKGKKSTSRGKRAHASGKAKGKKAWRGRRKGKK